MEIGAVNFTSRDIAAARDSEHKSRESLASFHRDPIDFPHGEKVRLTASASAGLSQLGMRYISPS